MSHTSKELTARIRFDNSHLHGLDTRLLDSLPDASILTDIEGIVLYWNASATRLFGWSAQEMVGQPYGQRYPEPMRSWITDEIRKRASGSNWEGEFEDLRRDGSRIWIHACVSRICNDRGEPVAILGISRDISQRKQTEADLIESQRRLDEAQRIARLASWIWEPHTEQVSWSDGLYDLFGVEKGKVTPSFEAFLSLLHPDDRPTAIERAKAVHTGTETIANDLRLIRPDGTLIWIHSRARATRDETGQVIRVEGTDQDITERKLAEQALKESEERYRILFEAMLDGLTIHDQDGKVIEVNTQMCKQLGYERHELIGQYPDFFDPNISRLEVKEIAEQGNSGRLLSFATTHRHRDGHLFPVEVSIRYSPMLGYNCLLSVTRDLTESQRTLSNLHETQARFRSVLDNSPLMVYIRDLDGKFVFVNRQFAEICQLKAEELTGRSATELFGSVKGQQFSANDVRVIQNGAPIQVEETLELPTGEVRSVLSVHFLLHNADGQLYAICSIVNDITERRKASEERDRLWNFSPDLLLIATDTGLIKQLNPAWHELLGWKDDQLIGSALIELVHPSDRQTLVDSLKRLAQPCVNSLQPGSQQIDLLALRFRCANNSYRWISWNALYVPGTKSICGFARDVTQQKVLEEKYQQSQKMEAIGQLAGGVAHDFNNLLTVIRSYSDLLLARFPVMDETVEQLMAIRDASERAAGLTAQLLAFSRKAIIEPKVIDLNKSVEAAARLLSRLIGEDIRLITQLAPELWKTTIDPVQLEQTLMNLAVNARDAMPRGGTLSICTGNVSLPEPKWPETDACAAGPYVQLCISDDGYGMSDEVKRHLFEPFYTTKGSGKGTGLGLATVYGIVHQAGGVIGVDSELGKGTTFRICLPAVVAAQVAREAVDDSAVMRGHETILLVEDEQAVRQLAKLILEMHGYRVVAASCGAEALAVAQMHDSPIDLLVSDVVMPDLPGRELADKVRQLRPNLRVLYMSGYTNDALMRNGVAAAADAFLPKPFTPISLTRKVREVLDAK